MVAYLRACAASAFVRVREYVGFCTRRTDRLKSASDL
jgi:hypothetical protein